MSIKKAGNPNWGGLRLDSKLIQKYADQWCKDNGYPIPVSYTHLTLPTNREV